MQYMENSNYIICKTFDTQTVIKCHNAQCVVHVLPEFGVCRSVT